MYSYMNAEEFNEMLKNVKPEKFRPLIAIHKDVGLIEIILDDCDRYGEWIPGERADACLFREEGTKRVVGALLPLEKFEDEITCISLGDKSVQVVEGDESDEGKCVQHRYDCVDDNGIRWRMDGARPVSELADHVMDKMRGKENGEE